jgi:hypothetical protein
MPFNFVKRIWWIVYNNFPKEFDSYRIRVEKSSFKDEKLIYERINTFKYCDIYN